MKESELISLKKKVESLTRVIEFLFNEIENTKTMSVGNYQLLKEMPGYDEAIKILMERTKPESVDNTEVKNIINEINK
jgi:hypothetical protein